MTEQPNKYRLDISINLADTYMGGRLEVRESVDVSATDFMEMAKILGLFHDLVKQIKKEHG
jgi:hypothetical protein